MDYLVHLANLVCFNIYFACQTIPSVCRLIFCMTETWEHVSVHWHQGKYQLRATCFTRWIPVLNRGPQNLRDPPPVVASVLTTRPWPIRRQKNRIGTSWAVSHIGYNSESILGRNDSPLGCLHLALAYRYYFLWRKHEIMFPCTGIRVNTNYERIASRGGCQSWTGDPTILDTPRPHCFMNIK